MTAVLALLLGAAATACWAPRLLRSKLVRRADPSAVIVAWCLSFAGTLLATAAGVALLLAPGHGGGAVSLVNACRMLVRHGFSSGIEVAAGVVTGLALATVLVRIGVLGVGSVRRRARQRDSQLATLRLAGRSDGASPATLWVPHAQPLAFSLHGRPGTVVATDGLRHSLPADQVSAVLAHERAHLSGRHHQLVAWAESAAAALPLVPLLREAPAALRELVELSADTAAATTCGPRAVRAALLGVCRVDIPPGALGIGTDSVDTRLARLQMVPRRTRARRTAVRGMAGVLAAALPFLASTAALAAFVTLSCPAVTAR